MKESRVYLSCSIDSDVMQQKDGRGIGKSPLVVYAVACRFGCSRERIVLVCTLFLAPIEVPLEWKAFDDDSVAYGVRGDAVGMLEYRSRGMLGVDD